MLQAPIRVVAALQPKIPLGILVATAVSTAVFTATPFLVKGVADDRGIEVGAVGLISTAQLGGFVLATWGAGRFLRPRRRLLVFAALLGSTAGVLSGLAPTFGLLVLARVVSGISLGITAWIAWAEVFGDDERVGDVAVIGPLVGVAAAPLAAIVIDQSGPDAFFFGLAALHLVPLAFMRTTRLEAAARPHRERHAPTQAAAALLACLGVITCGGSAVFVFAGAIGQDRVGLTPFVVALVFSANALAGVPSARFRGRRTLPGMWMGLTGVAAIAIGLATHPVVFWIALPLWGFSFWMGTPGAFKLLAERSAYPDERAGDAQSIMAGGRVVGPLIGGALYVASPVALGLVGGGMVLLAGAAMLYIEWRIHPDVLTDLVRST